MNKVETALKKFTREWSALAKESVAVENINGHFYAFGSELAVLRLFYAYKQMYKSNNPDFMDIGYSKPRKSWFFQRDVSQMLGSLLGEAEAPLVNAGDPREIVLKGDTLCAETGMMLCTGQRAIFYPNTKQFFSMKSNAAKSFRTWKTDTDVLGSSSNESHYTVSKHDFVVEITDLATFYGVDSDDFKRGDLVQIVKNGKRWSILGVGDHPLDLQDADWAPTDDQQAADIYKNLKHY